MSDYIYPDKFIKKSEQRIRDQIKGHGIDDKDVQIITKRMGEDILGGQTKYSVDINIKTQHSKGKSNTGRIIAQGETQREIETYRKTLGNTQSVKDTALNAIQSLPNKGFNADKVEIPLTAMKQQVTEHVTCPTCKGQGQCNCAQCHGQRYIQCPQCFATGYMKCMQCLGSGHMNVNGQQQPCSRCQGRGQELCTQCNGQRQIQCPTCRGQGMQTCQNCNGQGANSITTTMQPYITTQSSADIAALNPDAKIMVGKIGLDRLLNGGHITVATVKPPETNEEDDNRSFLDDGPTQSEKNKHTVFYQAKIPWAILHVITPKHNNTEDQRHNVGLIGKKGAMADSGEFFEPIIAPLMNIMAATKQKNANIASLLKQACAYRVSRETLLALTKLSPKKANAKLHQHFALGLKKQTLPTLVKYTYAALKRVTRKSRYIGLLSSLGLSTMIQYVWFINGLRDNYIPQSIRAITDYAPDIAPLAMGVVSAIILVKGFGFYAYHSVLKTIGIQNKKMPAMGMAGIYALVGAITLWGLGMASVFFNLNI